MSDPITPCPHVCVVCGGCPDCCPCTPALRAVIASLDGMTATFRRLMEDRQPAEQTPGGGSSAR
jgi:hypothetical protein